MHCLEKKNSRATFRGVTKVKGTLYEQLFVCPLNTPVSCIYNVNTKLNHFRLLGKLLLTW